MFTSKELQTPYQKKAVDLVLCNGGDYIVNTALLCFCRALSALRQNGVERVITKVLIRVLIYSYLTLFSLANPCYNGKKFVRKRM